MFKDMSKILSGRAVTPGDFKRNVASHQKFLEVMSALYPKAVITEEPQVFRKSGLVAFVPDFSVTMKNKTYFFEIKRQGPVGNAHERVYKIFSPGLISKVKEVTETDYHPVVAIFCDALAIHPRYLKEFEQNLEPGTYLPWDYQPKALKKFCDKLFK